MAWVVGWGSAPPPPPSPPQSRTKLTHWPWLVSYNNCLDILFWCIGPNPTSQPHSPIGLVPCYIIVFQFFFVHIQTPPPPPSPTSQPSSPIGLVPCYIIVFHFFGIIWDVSGRSLEVPRSKFSTCFELFVDGPASVCLIKLQLLNLSMLMNCLLCVA